MATAYAATAYDIGDTFAAALRGDEAVREVWARAAGGHFDIWVYTDPIEREQELRLYALEDVLYGRFPDADVRLHVEHAGLYDTTLYEVLPQAGAERIYASR